MTSPSRLTERQRTLVLDASVAINLLGTARAADLLRLIGREVVMEERAAAEVLRDPSTGRPGREGVDALRKAGLLRLERLSERDYASFLALVGATPPDDLDDGEAATIAYAEGSGAVPVLDDRKALKVCAGWRPEVRALTTVDLLSSREVVAGMAAGELADAVFAALRDARMRVVPAFRPWVVALIGEERATLCPSLGKVGVRPPWA